MKNKYQLTRHFIAIAGAILLVSANTPAFAGQAQTASQAVTIPADQLDALVAPIALYPDPLLSQTLVASTYPLEIMQLYQWLQRNPNLKGKALADAVAKQSWDPSVQAMAALPDLVKRLSDDVQWTTDLGNAFLAQQGDVMSAVQRMRAKAEQKGTLQSTPQQTVQTEVIDNKSVIVVEPANPDVVYVPSYNPEAVYGPPVYPYPGDLLSVVFRSRRRERDCLGHWDSDGRRMGWRLGRLGLERRLGPQRHRRQLEQQLQPQSVEPCGL